MSTARRGLGRGLEILVGGAGDGPELAQIRVGDIRPNGRQPRRRFEPEATTGLADSIRHQGLLQPVVVRPRPAGGYELIAGERRWRAAKEAGGRTKPRKATKVDPALAERVRAAAERVTGMSARVAPGRLEIHFENETELEELAEALERL